MKIMIFGDVASGKSTFSSELGKVLSLPVVHLDEVMATIGRERRSDIGEYIASLVTEPDWIIEGNAFTKDRQKRLDSADRIYVFESIPLVTFWRFVKRVLKAKLLNIRVLGGAMESLKLSYYVPYIFVKFPKRRNDAKLYAQSLGKKIVVIKSHAEANSVLENLKTGFFD